ncbi:SRPBCC family protein [Sunxiuqinia sp. A32]|uniref:SRPBCC family protein n=1 Tax=Sunxiuqinia sp. A32 TaxID=3461496 RepID=UPI004045B29F
MSKTNKNSGQKKQNNEMENQRMENQNSEDTFVISHVFETDSQTLFNMWITPEIYTSWMGPSGADMSFLNTDIQEGGSAHWQMTTPDGLTKYGKLRYKTINPNSELVYVQYFCDKEGNFIKAPFSATYPDSLLLSVNFVPDIDNKVKMTVKWEIYGESTEIERKTFNDMKPFMVKGWGESFAKIEVLLNSKK